MANFKDIEKFYKDSSFFFETGLMREIYADENICVCNLSNQTYCAFIYKKSLSGQAGVLLDRNMVEMVIKEPAGLSLIIEANRSLAFALNGRTAKILQNFKNYTDVNGPSTEIDFDFEEQLLKMNKQGKNR